MFTTHAVIFVALAVFLIGQVSASPLPMPLRAIKAREVAFDVIPAYVRRASDTNTYPEQSPAKSDNGEIVSYPRKRTTNTYPEQSPAKSDNGEI
ncbi:hypothetical protein PILCRDRAFT_2737, partial [Piloderma croceum F 1598]